MNDELKNLIFLVSIVILWWFLLRSYQTEPDVSLKRKKFWLLIIATLGLLAIFLPILIFLAIQLI